MSDVPEKYKDLPRWAFGNTPELADELLALVLIGKKTATCCSLSEYQDQAWPMPKKGDRWIVLDGAKRPRAVIETTNLEVKPFDHNSKQHALLRCRDCHTRSLDNSPSPLWPKHSDCGLPRERPYFRRNRFLRHLP